MTFPDFLAAHLGARDVLRVDPFPPGASIPPFVVNVFVDHEARETAFQVDGSSAFRQIAAGDPAVIQPIAERLERAINLTHDRRATYLAGETEALERAHAVARSIRSAGYPAIVRYVESEPRRAPTLPRPVAGWGKS